VSARAAAWGNRHRGEVIAGKYELEEVLGEGGMGTVYRAQHLALKQPVAIKMMHAELSGTEKYRQRFTREARVSSMLQHPNAVRVYDFGEHQGSLYLVMECLPGKPLRQMIRRSSLPSLPTMIEVGIQVANALDAAHALRLIHRDLKPDNIMVELRDDGELRAVLVDFGLAFQRDPKQETPDPELGRLTTVGLVSGTPQYMSPEQARGLDVDPALDVYALGCVMFEMAVGRPPFEGASAMDILNCHIFVPAPSARARAPQRGVPQALDDLILEMMRKQATQRPTAAEVSEALTALRDGKLSELTAQRGQRFLTPRSARAEAVAPPYAVRTVVGQDLPEPGVVAVLGWPLEHPLRLALMANGYTCQDATLDAVPERAEVVFAPRADLAHAARLCAHGRPVLVTAQAGDMEVMAQWLRAGVEEVILEPVRAEEMLKKVQRALRKARRGRKEGA
jgi:tRNA A-37 threonylcarbamoyl transferase component Bud32